MQEIEGVEMELVFSAPRILEGVEIGTALRIECDDLTIENERFGWLLLRGLIELTPDLTLEPLRC